MAGGWGNDLMQNQMEFLVLDGLYVEHLLINYLNGHLNPVIKYTQTRDFNQNNILHQISPCRPLKLPLSEYGFPFMFNFLCSTNITDQASGNLGPTVLSELLDAGLTVTVLTRQNSNKTFDPRAQVEKVDYESRKSLKAALAGNEVVVNTLGVGTVPRETYLRLVDAAVAAGVQRFLPTPRNSQSSLIRLLFRSTSWKFPSSLVSVIPSLSMGLSSTGA